MYSYTWQFLAHQRLPALEEELQIVQVQKWVQVYWCKMKLKRFLSSLKSYCRAKCTIVLSLLFTWQSWVSPGRTWPLSCFLFTSTPTGVCCNTWPTWKCLCWGSDPSVCISLVKRIHGKTKTLLRASVQWAGDLHFHFQSTPLPLTTNYRGKQGRSCRVDLVAILRAINGKQVEKNVWKSQMSGAKTMQKTPCVPSACGQLCRYKPCRWEDRSCMSELHAKRGQRLVVTKPRRAG